MAWLVAHWPGSTWLRDSLICVLVIVGAACVAIATWCAGKYDE